MSPEQFEKIGCGSGFIKVGKYDYYLKPKQNGPFEGKVIDISSGDVVDYEDLSDEFTLCYGSEVMW